VARRDKFENGRKAGDWVTVEIVVVVVVVISLLGYRCIKGRRDD
jgi:uncharacterized protein (DUF983 family)